MYCQELLQRFAKEEENQKGPTRDIQEHSICKFYGVHFTSGGERASFEKPFSPVGQIREESVKWGQLNNVRDICTFAILCSVTRPFLSLHSRS